jgi:hypothetical protein
MLGNSGAENEQLLRHSLASPQGKLIASQGISGDRRHEDLLPRRRAEQAFGAE